MPSKHNTPPEEEQLAVQRAFWELPPTAGWAAIRDVARARGGGVCFFNFEDWEETMVRLYDPDFDNP